jgi:hypothetical protein
MMRPAQRRAGLTITVLATVGGAIFVPAMWFDRVVISPTEIRQKTGLWFAPTLTGFSYADVESITIRGRRSSREWFVELVGGGQDHCSW